MLNQRIAAELSALPLGERAVIHGVRVVRRSLFGFQVARGRDLVETAEAAARVLSAVRRPEIRVQRCSRCVGDGLGRRNRGACGLCHGRGVQIVAPLGGWREGLPEEVASAVEQALSALPCAGYPRARESLRVLLDALLPLTEPAIRGRALAALAERDAATGARAA